VDSENRDWPNHLSVVTWALNTTPSRATGYSPFEMLFGEPATTPFTVVANSKLPAPKTADEYVKRLHDRLALIKQQADKIQRAMAAKNKEAYDQKHEDISFDIGEYVLVHDVVIKRTGGSRKLNPSFTKPAKIIAKVTPLVYVVQLSDKRRRNKGILKCHVQRLLKFTRRDEDTFTASKSKSKPTSNKPEPATDSEEEETADAVQLEEPKPAAPVQEMVDDRIGDESKTEELKKEYVVLRTGHGQRYLVHLTTADVLVWMNHDEVPDPAVELYRSRARDRTWRCEAAKLEDQLQIVSTDPN
jgi:hypothetical protein